MSVRVLLFFLFTVFVSSRSSRYFYELTYDDDEMFIGDRLCDRYGACMELLHDCSFSHRLYDGIVIEASNSSTFHMVPIQITPVGEQWWECTTNGVLKYTVSGMYNQPFTYDILRKLLKR